MKKTTLFELYASLDKETTEVTVNSEVMDKAKGALKNMVKYK